MLRATLAWKWWRRKQESRIDGFVSLSKMSFLRLNKGELSFLKLWIQKIFLFPKRNCSEQYKEEVLKVSQQMVNTRWMFPTKGRISLSKNSVFQRNEEFWTEIFYELKNSSYFYTHKYFHYVLYSFSWQGFAFSLFVPKTSFCLKIVDECKAPTYTGNRLLFNTK